MQHFDLINWLIIPEELALSLQFDSSKSSFLIHRLKLLEQVGGFIGLLAQP
jgi:hypothetical protein